MKTTRRSFVTAAGALSASMLGCIGRGAALADAPAAGAPDSGMRLDAGGRPDAGEAAQSPGAIAQLARERYGKFLDDQQLKLLDAKLSDIEGRSKRLHAFKLKNGDEPASEFRPVRP
ncbi:MAG TPA: hypothetical protein VKB87_17380 [Myxococcaceae bacterium]|nr:hypothetical protein [Myxococcaceae bacterium]